MLCNPEFHTVLPKYLARFCCSDFLNTSDKKSGPREFQKKKAYRNCCGFVPWARKKLKVRWGHVSLLSPKSALFQSVWRTSWLCGSSMYHSWLDGAANPQQSMQKHCCKDLVPQRAADFSSFIFCWCKTFPPPISETNYWYILIITLHPDSSPWICKLIRVIRVLATVWVKYNNFMVSTH